MRSPRFLYLPSAGFSASFGISHKRLNFATPGMRFSSHSFCTRLSEMPHFFAASGAEIYSNIFIHPFSNLYQYNYMRLGEHFQVLKNRIMEMCIAGYGIPPFIYLILEIIILQIYLYFLCKIGFSPDKYRLFFSR